MSKGNSKSQAWEKTDVSSVDTSLQDMMAQFAALQQMKGAMGGGGQPQPQGQQMAAGDYPASAGSAPVTIERPTMGSAQETLKWIQQNGGRGYITPIGPNGQGGFSVYGWGHNPKPGG